MSQKESRLSNRIRKELLLHFGSRLFIFKVWGNEHMMAGLPDLVGCVDGKFFALEVKRPETRSNTSAVQEYVMGKIREAGGIAGVITTPAEAINVLTWVTS
jgi:hypothetical protein